VGDTFYAEEEGARTPSVARIRFPTLYRTPGTRATPSSCYFSLTPLPLQPPDVYSLPFSLYVPHPQFRPGNTIRSVRAPAASVKCTRGCAFPPSLVAALSDAPPRATIHGGCILSLYIVTNAASSPFNSGFLNEESELNGFGDPEKHWKRGNGRSRSTRTLAIGLISARPPDVSPNIVKGCQLRIHAPSAIRQSGRVSEPPLKLLRHSFISVSIWLQAYERLRTSTLTPRPHAIKGT